MTAGMGDEGSRGCHPQAQHGARHVPCSSPPYLMNWSPVFDMMVRLLDVDFCGIYDGVDDRVFTGHRVLYDGAVAGAGHSPISNDAGA